MRYAASSLELSIYCRMLREPRSLATTHLFLPPRKYWGVVGRIADEVYTYHSSALPRSL